MSSIESNFALLLLPKNHSSASNRSIIPPQPLEYMEMEVFSVLKAFLHLSTRPPLFLMALPITTSAKGKLHSFSTSLARPEISWCIRRVCSQLLFYHLIGSGGGKSKNFHTSSNNTANFLQDSTLTILSMLPNLSSPCLN